MGALTWNQDLRDYGVWKKLKNGVSKKFTLPAIKAKKTEETTATKKKSNNRA